MALPSSVRPQEVEEEILKSSELKTTESDTPKIKLTWRGIFIKIMTEWYEGLSQKKKKKLTGYGLKRRALFVCYQNNIIYNTLPLDWVAQLAAQTGLKLYERKKKTPKVNVGPFTPSSSIRDKKFKGLQNLISGASEPGGFGLGGADYIDLEDTTGTGDGDTAQTLSGPKNATVKKFLDLSGQAPPPIWLESYANGTVLPRELKVYSTDDLNILYYDYNPKLKDSLGRDVKMGPKPRHNFNVFNANR